VIGEGAHRHATRVARGQASWATCDDIVCSHRHRRRRSDMPIDNAMYDRLSHTWWEEGSFLNFLKAGLNPVRFGYMHRVLSESIGVDPAA